ncbi:MAG TPA: anti-sigma factor [Armatimonadota bacterium]|nr:anti-sigma factor [Armatimonadota bacterium]
MTRRHVDEWYTAYLEGSLPEEARRRVDAHLGACPRCAAGLDQMRTLVDALRAVPAPAAPDNMAAAVRERLTRRAPRPLWPAWATAGALAAAIAVALAAPIWQRGAEMAKAPDAPAPVTGDTRRELLPDAARDAGEKTLTKPAPPAPATGRPLVTIATDPFAGGGKVKPAAPPAPTSVITRESGAPRAAGAAVAADDGDIASSAVPLDASAAADGTMMAKGSVATAPADDAGALTDTGELQPGTFRTSAAEAPANAAPTTSMLQKSALSPPAAVRLTETPTADAQAAPLPLRAAIVNGAQLQLRMAAAEAGSLRVTAGKTERRYDVTPPETVITLETTAGATYRLALTTGAATADYYLLTPDRAQAKTPGAPAPAGRPLPALEALRGWTDASGYALLAPHALVNGEAALSAFTLDALQAYAAARNARAALDGGVATLSPKQ